MLKRRLLVGGAWTLFSRVGGVAMALAINMLLAKMLAPEEVGVFYLGMSIVAAMVVLTQMGFTQAVVKLVVEAEVAGVRGQASAIIRRLLLLVLSFAVITSILFDIKLGDWAADAFHAPGLHVLVSLLSLLILLNSIQGVIAEAFRGFHNIKLAALLGGMLAQGVVLALLFAHSRIHEETTLREVTWFFVVGATVATVISLVLMGKRLEPKSDAHRMGLSELFHLSWPMYGVQVMIMIFGQVDLWIVGMFLEPGDVAIYGAMQKLLVLITVTYTLMVSVVQSSVAELYARGDKVGLEKLVRVSGFVACIPATLMTIIIMFWGDSIFKVVFGEYYVRGALLLQVLCVGHLLGMWMGPGGMVLIMTGGQKQMVRISMWTGLMMTILAVAGAQWYGVLGVTLAWAAGAVIYGVAMWRATYALLGVRVDARPTASLWDWKMLRRS